MIAGLGPFEIIIILVIILVIFGPKNLPKLGSALGKTVKNVREGMDGVETASKADEVEDDAEDAEDVEEVAGDSDEDAPGDGVFCPKCGSKNASDAAFCSKCGNKLGE